MISALKISDRDKLALLVLATFFISILIYFGVRISFDYKNEAMDDFRESRLLLMDISGNGRKISMLENSQKSRAKMGSDQTLLTLASISAKEKDIAFKRFQPDGDSLLQLWLEDANFDTLLRWLFEIETKNGIRVAQISVERTKRDGFVNARVTLVR